jgi:hypothetical protein
MLIRGWKNTFVLYHIFGCRIMKRKFKQSHQYQQNEQPLLTSNTTTTCGIGNQGLRLGQTQKCNRDKSVNGTLSF